jgi:hypothetical protein
MSTKTKSTKPKTKTAAAVLIDAVCKPKGATHAELCKLVGWKQCRPYLLKVTAAAKIKLRKQKEEGGQVRYFGSKPGRTRAATSA